MSIICEVRCLNMERVIVQKDRTFGLRVLSNVVEIDTGNVTFMRALGFKFEELGLIDYAVNLYERVLESRLKLILHSNRFFLFFRSILIFLFRVSC